MKCSASITYRSWLTEMTIAHIAFLETPIIQLIELELKFIKRLNCFCCKKGRNEIIESLLVKNTADVLFYTYYYMHKY